MIQISKETKSLIKERKQFELCGVEFSNEIENPEVKEVLRSMDILSEFTSYTTELNELLIVPKEDKVELLLDIHINTSARDRLEELFIAINSSIHVMEPSMSIPIVTKNLKFYEMLEGFQSSPQGKEAARRWISRKIPRELADKLMD